MEDSSSLFTREKGFIEVAYEHPREIHSLANGHEVVPKVWALSMIGACIDTGTGSGGVSTVDFNGYGELVVVKDGCGSITGGMLKKPNSSRVAASFYNMYRCVTHIRPKNRKFSERNMCFKNSHEGWLVPCNQIFQVSS